MFAAPITFPSEAHHAIRGCLYQIAQLIGESKICPLSLCGDERVQSIEVLLIMRSGRSKTTEINAEYAFEHA